MSTTVALVPAAGRGERLGGAVPKAFRELLGEPLLVHAVRRLMSARNVGLVAVAAPVDMVGRAEVLLAGPAADLGVPVAVVPGGRSRAASVGAALAAVSEEFDVVLVHDAARALTPVEVIDGVDAAVRAGASAVVPALPVVDTVKRIEVVAGDEVVLDTPDRSMLRAIQTPQGFRRDVLEAAHAIDFPDATDDASQVERLGHRVHVIEGSVEAMKITHPIDLLLAEVILDFRSSHDGDLGPEAATRPNCGNDPQDHREGGVG